MESQYVGLGADPFAAISSYGYPKIVSELISEFQKTVRTVYPHQQTGILLVGSTARGELSWAKSDSRTILFGDIEFIVAVDSRRSQDLEKLDSELAEVERQKNLGDLFHFDYVVIPWRRLSTLDTKFFIFESRECGVDIGSKPIRPHLPVVRRHNLNFKELNEVLLHRVEALLSAVPSPILSGAKTPNKYFSLAIAKNALDITTWLHPYDADRLIAGFSSRLSDWNNNFPNRDVFAFITRDHLDFLNACMQQRKNPLVPTDPLRQLSHCVDLYESGLEFLRDHWQMGSATIDQWYWSRKLFDEYRIRRRVRNFIDAFRRGRRQSMYGFFNLTLGARKGIQIMFCLMMLRAFVDHIEQKSSDWEHLQFAESKLSRLIIAPQLNRNDFSWSWLELRQSYQEMTAALT